MSPDLMLLTSQVACFLEELGRVVPYASMIGGRALVEAQHWITLVLQKPAAQASLSQSAYTSQKLSGKRYRTSPIQC